MPILSDIFYLLDFILVQMVDRPTSSEDRYQHFLDGSRWPLRHQSWIGALPNSWNCTTSCGFLYTQTMSVSVWMIPGGHYGVIMPWNIKTPENLPNIVIRTTPVTFLGYVICLWESVTWNLCQRALFCMPTQTRRMSQALAEFTSSFLSCLEDSAVAERMQLIFEPVFKAHLDPISGKMAESIKMLTQTVEALKKECDTKDRVIHKLNQDVIHLQSRVDNLEQHGRKDSVRIFGLSETTPGTTDQKVLRLCNKRMKLQPPLTLDEIAISHRVGKVNEPAEDGTPGAPRALLVKFATRRSKNRVISARKKLKPTNEQEEGQTEEHNGDDEDLFADGRKIYIGDDLTKTRAYLAFRARQAKRNHQISDTWVIDCKVMIKDNFSRISQVTSLHELEGILSQ